VKGATLSRRFSGIIDAGSNTWIANLPTVSDAHSVAVDSNTGNVFVPVAPTRTAGGGVSASDCSRSAALQADTRCRSGPLRTAPAPAAQHRHQTTPARFGQAGRESKLMRIFQPNIIPGILQTAEYAEAVLRRYIDFYRVPDDLDQGVSKRLERQQLLYKGDHRFPYPDCRAGVVDHGRSDAVMAGAVGQLLAVIAYPRALLGTVPAQDELPMQVTNFVMFDTRLVLVEAITAELTVTQPREIAIYGDRHRVRVAGRRERQVRRPVLRI